MTSSTMMKMLAVALLAVLGVALVPACDKLGLGDGGGGAGGGDPLGGVPARTPVIRSMTPR